LKTTIHSFWIILILLAVTACKTQKSRSDLSPIAKLYHNTTAEFNGYFNADVLVTESINALDNQYQDNYNKVLPLYPYLESSNPKAMAENLNNAIEKVSIVVALHRQSHWTDDCYLLIGKAQFLKQDFESAEETLKFLIKEFPGTTAGKTKGSKSSKSKEPEGEKTQSKSESSKTLSGKELEKQRAKARKERSKEIKRRKKERAKAAKLRKKGKKVPSTGSRTTKKEDPKDNTEQTETEEEEIAEPEPEQDQPIETISIGSDYEREIEGGSPESYFLRHRPAYQEGLLWLARTYIERENYPEAERLMTRLDRSGGTFTDIRGELAVVQAYYQIQRNNYDQAIPYLEKAIKFEKDRYRKARLAYIIAQIHQQSKRSQEAYAGFERVLKLKPLYDMEFSARLSMAQNAWLNGQSSPEEAKKELNKMLKDEKNVEYQDKIYYALAQIDLQTGDKDSAIENLLLSIANGSGNAAQQTESYYTLGTLYFEKEEYVEAKTYYDLALGVMPKTDERYAPTSKIANSLTDIAENIVTIELQDSLLRISRLSEDEQKALAFEIKKREDDARRQALLDKAAGNQAKGGRSALAGNGSNAGPNASSFFAYNDRSLKRGLRDFEREWGTRPLEDNWRRGTDSNAGDIEELEELEEVASTVLTDDDVARILKDVPRTPDQVKIADKKIMDALFNLGRLYRERLNNNKKSVATLEELLKRYPDTQYKVDALYFLYLAHTDLKNTAEAKKYYDELVNNYPNTNIVRSLLDPEYVKRTMDKEQQLNRYYDEAYASFTSGQFEEAYQKIQKAPQKFGTTHDLRARFDLLGAMCVGNIEGEEAYIRSLKDVVAKYPNSTEQKRAKEILRLLGVVSTTGPGAELEEGEESPYEIEFDKLHYMIVVFDNKINLARAKADVSDYHKKFHNLDKLRISNIYLGDAENRVPIIVIRRFKDKTEAMNYYDGVQKNMKEYLSMDVEFSLYAVSQNNYRQILKNKSVAGYGPFFDFNYLD
jgi:tetratricopeptide (TPR) repeat protein